MNNTYLDERGSIVTLAELQADFNAMTEPEKAEYSNNFTEYVKACMPWNGGTLTPIDRLVEEYNRSVYSEVLSLEKYIHTCCEICNKNCMHKNAARRLPIECGGLGLCENLSE